jgi:hypothetical protein
LLSLQAYRGGELIWTNEQSQTLGLPLALAFIVNGLSIRLLSEQPVSIADTHTAINKRINQDKSLTMFQQFPNGRPLSRKHLHSCIALCAHGQ